ncbi:MAG: phosphate/phosphite/phosphonate ABC transporter substrate-binding protein [Bacillota bacterium]
MKRITAVLLLIFTAALLVSGCGAKEKSGAQPDPARLKVALLPDESPSTVIKNNEPLKQYLSKALGKEIEIVVTTDYSSMIEAMRNNQIDVAYFGPLSYVLLKQKMSDVVPFAAKIEKGSPAYQAVVIANTGSGIKSLQDVRGKTVAYGDQASTSSHLIPKEMLLSQSGLKSGQDYKEQFVGAHDAVAMAVQNNNAQAGGLSKPIFEALVQRKVIDPGKVQVIAESKPYPNYPWVMRTTLSTDLQEKIKKSFIDLKDKDVLKPLKAEGFAPMSDQDYDVIRNMVKVLNIDLEKA